MDDIKYQSGFGNEFASEAAPGAQRDASAHLTHRAIVRASLACMRAWFEPLGRSTCGPRILKQIYAAGGSYRP